MGLFGKWRVHRSRGRDVTVDVSEEKGVRSLHLGSDTVQSSMRIADPVELVLSYTQSMTAFLLWHPAPRHIALIGLGGGSLSKFFHHHFPQTRVTTVELNPRVVSVARQWFSVPPDDARFTIEIDDGAQWVRAHRAGCDVLVVDAYDGDAQVEALADEDFYAACWHALTDDGVLVVNLWSSDRRFDGFLQRIERVFADCVVCLPAERRGNVAVFAFRSRPMPTRFDRLRLGAESLERALGVPYRRFVDRLRDLNAHTEHELLV
ncbi:MAG: polyamine aminopropyltransferase [Burkholderiales bacterium]|jgi:spermidine synthase|nr:polyamine aminopropyltransferase [Burkholderiales bacterium]